MPSPADYRLRVTAGTSYDPATHVPVAVNDAAPLVLHGPGADVALNVRVRGGRLAAAAGPDAAANTAYFDAEPHKRDADTYSIGLWLVPRRRLAARDLVWGNDFDTPIRQWLPPGFGAALRFVTWWVDPGLEGDPYGDRPFLYGPALSSFNRVYVGDAAGEGGGGEGGKMDNAPHHPQRGLWFSEGGSADGRAWRTSVGCPGPSDDQDANEDDAAAAAARRKWALSLPQHASDPDADAGGDTGGDAGGDAASPVWTWEPGRGYGLDFYNGFVDFDALAVRLPGRSMLPTFPLLHFWDGKTSVRYVLRQRPAEGEGKDKDDDNVLLVVVFALVPAAEEATTADGGGAAAGDGGGAAAAGNGTAISIDDVD